MEEGCEEGEERRERKYKKVRTFFSPSPWEGISPRPQLQCHFLGK